AGLNAKELAVLAVEGKAGESFGKHVRAWRDGSEKKEKRLEGLCDLLCLSTEAAMPLRDQLLHRTASAILDAKRYRTHTAALRVHGLKAEEAGLAGSQRCTAAIGLETLSYGSGVGPIDRGGLSL